MWHEFEDQHEFDKNLLKDNVQAITELETENLQNNDLFNAT